jgi:hypothetical protein
MGFGGLEEKEIRKGIILLKSIWMETVTHP